MDTWAFGLGSGLLAGLAGCALSQIGNVGPDLGQGYIVDSLWSSSSAWASSWEPCTRPWAWASNKLLETWQGAVIAKIAVLVFIIIFIQKRPQGLFALKGRAVES